MKMLMTSLSNALRCVKNDYFPNISNNGGDGLYQHRNYGGGKGAVTKKHFGLELHLLFKALRFNMDKVYVFDVPRLGTLLRPLRNTRITFYKEDVRAKLHYR